MLALFPISKTVPNLPAGQASLVTALLLWLLRLLLVDRLILLRWVLRGRRVSLGHLSLGIPSVATLVVVGVIAAVPVLRS
jgi:hypothetical protein